MSSLMWFLLGAATVAVPVALAQWIDRRWNKVEDALSLGYRAPTRDATASPHEQLYGATAFHTRRFHVVENPAGVFHGAEYSAGQFDKAVSDRLQLITPATPRPTGVPPHHPV
jgi:hypothetical protein